MAEDRGFVTFKGTTEGITDAFYKTQAAADAGATQSDLTAVQGEQPLDGFVPNVAYWNGAKLTDELPEIKAFEALSSEDQINERRAYLFDLLRRHEVVGGKISVWHGSRVDNVPEGDPPMTGDDERLDQSKRFASYGRWVEANVRAALVDENLTNEAKYAFLKAECEIPGETWYWLHKVNGTQVNGGWYLIYGMTNVRADWVWHYTTGTTVTSNSRVGVRPPNTLLLELDATADWVKELQ